MPGRAFLSVRFVSITTAGNVPPRFASPSGTRSRGVVGAWLVNPFAGGPFRVFDRAQDVFQGIWPRGFCGALELVPSLGLTSLALGGFANWTKYAPHPGRHGGWVISAGALILCPVLLSSGVSSVRDAAFRSSRDFEVGVLFDPTRGSWRSRLRRLVSDQREQLSDFVYLWAHRDLDRVSVFST